MKEYKELLKDKLLSSRKGIFVFSTLFTLGISMPYFLLNEQVHTLMEITIVILGVFIFMSMASILFVIVLIIFGELVRRRNIFGLTILFILILLYSIFFAKSAVDIILGFYNEDSVLNEAQYLSAVISVVSLLVAIIMPLILTEKNRRESLEIIKNNRIDAYMPVLSYSVLGVLQNSGSGICKLIVKDLDKVQDYIEGTYLEVEIKNVSDRIGVNIHHYIDNNCVKLLNEPIVRGSSTKLRIYAKEHIEAIIKTSEPVLISKSVFVEDIYATKYEQVLHIQVKINDENMIYATLESQDNLKII